MTRKYSIAQARDNLASIVHQLETVRSVEITRRGQAVAFLLSKQEYDRLQGRNFDFWEGYQSFLKQVDLKESQIDPEQVFGGLRDKPSGREVDL